jgi:hypothetical protein
VDASNFFTLKICKKWTAHSFISVAGGMVVKDSIKDRSNKRLGKKSSTKTSWESILLMNEKFVVNAQCCFS